MLENNEENVDKTQKKQEEVVNDTSKVNAEKDVVSTDDTNEAVEEIEKSMAEDAEGQGVFDFGNDQNNHILILSLMHFYVFLLFCTPLPHIFPVLYQNQEDTIQSISSLPRIHNIKPHFASISETIFRVRVMIESAVCHAIIVVLSQFIHHKTPSSVY